MGENMNIGSSKVRVVLDATGALKPMQAESPSEGPQATRSAMGLLGETSTLSPILIQELHRLCGEASVLREDIVRQLDGAKQRMLQRVVLARASKLTPTCHRDLVRRARHLQQKRSDLTRTLYKHAKQLVASRDITAFRSSASSTLPPDDRMGDAAGNLQAILHVVHTSLEQERQWTHFSQRICPPASVFVAFCAEALGKRKLHQRLETELERNHGEESASSLPALHGNGNGALEEALDLLLQLMAKYDGRELVLIDHNEDEERPDGATLKADEMVCPRLEKDRAIASDPVVRIPCIVSLEQYCCDAPWSLEAVRESKDGFSITSPSTLGFLLPFVETTGEGDLVRSHCRASGLQKDGSEVGGQEVQEDDKWRLTQFVVERIVADVNATWSTLELPSIKRVCGHEGSQADAEEVDSGVDSFLDALRVRYAVELAARVVGYQTAMRLLPDSEDSVLFDDGRDVLLQITDTREAPVHLISLPAMEKVFYCIAFCVGAALTSDSKKALGNGTPKGDLAPVVIDLNDETCVRSLLEVDVDNEEEPLCRGRRRLQGWAAGLERLLWGTARESRACQDAPAFFSCALRLWCYLWEYVFVVQSAGDAPDRICVSKTTARRWQVYLAASVVRRARSQVLLVDTNGPGEADTEISRATERVVLSQLARFTGV